ncbi:RNase P protein component [Gammaproteobacteria bacterium]
MAGAEFPQTLRLLRASQFERVFAQARKVSGSGLTVLARGNDLSHPRLGLVVSKRSARAAVARNRIKRLAREAFRHLQDRLGGVDLIVLSRPGLTERDNPTLAGLLSKYLLDAASRCRGS